MLDSIIHRRSRGADISPTFRNANHNPEIPSTDSSATFSRFEIMKERLIQSPNATSTDCGDSRHHFTEKDLQVSFGSEKEFLEPSPTRAGATFQKTKQHAKHWRERYIGNCSWWTNLARRSIPIVDFIRTYQKSYIVPDLVAGVSVGVASLPMGMSYALLVNLPPAHGLYNNLFYPLVYMLLGTGRQVCVGTSAIEAMLATEAVANVVGWDAEPAVWLNGMIGFSLCVGVIMICMRLLGLGVIASFLADPVLSGFSTGSAIVIGTSQLKHVFGLTIPRLDTAETWWYILSSLNEVNWGACIICVSGVAILAASKIINRKWFKKFPLPGSLVLICVFILISWAMQIDSPPYNIKVIGQIPIGFPAPLLFDFSSGIIGPLFQQALLYSVLYFVIHISIAKTIAQQNKYTLDADQEFLAVGVCSVVGSFFQCFPIATSLSRSSVANVTGARTPLFNITNALVVGLTISVITPLLFYLPLATLASVVVFGVYWMMDFREAYRLALLFSPDFLLWLVCCVVTVFVGSMEGIIASVALSLLWLLKKAAWPSTAILGRLPETCVYRNIKRFPMAKEIEGLKIFRFDASLNFANADYFDNKVSALMGLGSNRTSPSPNISEHSSQLVSKFPPGSPSPRVENLSPDSTTILMPTPQDELATSSPTSENVPLTRVLIVDASSINDLDVTAIRMLQQVATKLNNEGCAMLFANWKGPMRDFLEKARFYDTVPPENCFLCLSDAVTWAEVVYLRRREDCEVLGLGDDEAVVTEPQQLKHHIMSQSHSQPIDAYITSSEVELVSSQDISSDSNEYPAVIPPPYIPQPKPRLLSSSPRIRSAKSSPGHRKTSALVLPERKMSVDSNSNRRRTGGLTARQARNTEDLTSVIRFVVEATDTTERQWAVVTNPLNNAQP